MEEQNQQDSTEVTCPSCGSASVNRRGRPNALLAPHRWRYSCKACSENFYINLSSSDEPTDTEEVEVISDDEPRIRYIRDDEYLSKILSAKKLVITSAINNSPVDQTFLDTLEVYSRNIGAELVVVPLIYRKPVVPGAEREPIEFASELEPYLVDNMLEFSGHPLVIRCETKISPTAANPLSGFDPSSQGRSLVIGHPQVQFKNLPRGTTQKYPATLSTTGAVTIDNYNHSKVGVNAEFNHSLSGIVVELADDGEIFTRGLNFDGKGFYDLDRYYTPDGSEEAVADTIITGDSHVRFHDPEVFEATYGKDGLFKTLAPSKWFIHDVLDFSSQSHWSIRDQFSVYYKYLHDTAGVEDEVQEACEFIINNKPAGCTAYVVASNHDMHLDRWIKEVDTRRDPQNAKVFHYLSYLMYDYMDSHDGNLVGALELFFKDKYKDENDVVFLKETDSFKVHGIELASHGHNGQGGSRASIAQFSRLPEKTVTGHSHSNFILKGAYSVGTSSVFNMNYVKGASSWDHVHCVIYPNGKRQLVQLRNGKFRA